MLTHTRGRKHKHKRTCHLATRAGYVPLGVTDLGRQPNLSSSLTCWTPFSGWPTFLHSIFHQELKGRTSDGGSFSSQFFLTLHVSSLAIITYVYIHQPISLNMISLKHLEGISSRFPQSFIWPQDWTYYILAITGQTFSVFIFFNTSWTNHQFFNKLWTWQVSILLKRTAKFLFTRGAEWKKPSQYWTWWSQQEE